MNDDYSDLVGRKFTIKDIPDNLGYPTGFNGKRGVVTKVVKVAGEYQFDMVVHNFAPTKAEKWFLIGWGCRYWTAKQNEVFIWDALGDGGDYFSHDWQTAANRKRDEIYRRILDL